MQREVTPGGADRTAARPCPRCGAPLRGSHREYAGRGASILVLRCAACGHTVSGPPRPDAERAAHGRRRGRHAPVDEGPPSNPVIDSETARRLLDGLGP